MEQRHDWAKMTFTVELFKYVLTVLIPEVVVHSQDQDQEQVRGHYDRTSTFYFSVSLTYQTFAQVVTTSTNGTSTHPVIHVLAHRL
jgi:hypothetical protein